MPRRDERNEAGDTRFSPIVDSSDWPIRTGRSEGRAFPFSHLFEILQLSFVDQVSAEGCNKPRLIGTAVWIPPRTDTAALANDATSTTRRAQASEAAEDPDGLQDMQECVTLSSL